MEMGIKMVTTKAETKEELGKKEYLALGSKQGACELCKGDLSNWEFNEKCTYPQEPEFDWLIADVENCEIWIHKKCLERAKMLTNINWCDE